MPLRRHRVAQLALPAALALSSVAVAAAQAPSDREVENLRAFARLYGYVRFFHPADEAAAVDWDRFAVHGVERVRGATDASQLRAALEDLFDPIAPAIRLYPTDAAPPGDKVIPDDTAGLELVAWQHQGVWLGPASSIYRSVRINRPPPPGQGASFGVVTQLIDAAEYRGRRVQLRAAVRANVSGPGNQGQLWLRVDRAQRQMGYFDNMGDRPITSNEWSVHEIEGPVAKDAARIAFGAFLNGAGTMWVDGFELRVGSDEGGWEPVPLENPGFEQVVEGVPAAWSIGSPGYVYTPDEDAPHSGMLSLRVEKDGSVRSHLFPETPRRDEVIEKELGAGLAVQLPLALFTDEQGTLPHAPSGAGNELARELNRIDVSSLTADDVRVRLADIVIAWNVFQHFYPYFDVVEVDWDRQLTLGLERALADENARDFFDTLRLLVAALQDGHGYVSHEKFTRGYAPPLRLGWVEDRVVVTATGDTSLFQVGDVVVSIDGADATDALREAEKYYSGSRQWRRRRALVRLPQGEDDTMARFILERARRRLEVTAKRTGQGATWRPERPHIEELRPGIFYVNLDNTPMADIDARMAEIAAARGVIFDLRGYPNSNHDVLRRLLPGPDTTTAWMRVPQIIYPDREKLVGYVEHGWGMQPAEPRITGKVVFITDERAISYAESVMGFVHGYRLGEIVGSPTAGANGNVNRIALPGGFHVTFTGMRVVKHDGSQLHTIGFLPTVPTQPTVAGLRAGRDEVLERALEIVEEGR